MAFVPYTVEDGQLDGLTHAHALTVILTEMIEQFNEFAASDAVKCQIRGLDNVLNVVNTNPELLAINGQPILQAINENQLTGQLQVSLNIPIRNSLSGSSVVTEPRFSFGEIV